MLNVFLNIGTQVTDLLHGIMVSLWLTDYSASGKMHLRERCTLRSNPLLQSMQ